MPVRSFSPFRHRGYLLVWVGALVSNIGTWMETTALSYFVADTSSAGASGLVAAAGFIPTALLAPLGGAWADRFDRRRIIAVSNGPTEAHQQLGQARQAHIRVRVPTLRPLPNLRPALRRPTQLVSPRPTRPTVKSSSAVLNASSRYLLQPLV